MFIKEEVEYIKNNIQDIEMLIQKHMNRCFGQTRNVSVGMITISFMNTSLYLKRPVFRFGFYEEDVVWKNPILEHEMPADWLFHNWPYDLETEKEVVEVRQQIRPLLFYASAVFKYALAECFKFSNYGNLKKAEELYICFGEYKDWQFPIYIDKDEIDIFNNVDDEMLTFRRFDKKVYRNKEFNNLDLTSAKFTDCEFSHVTFHTTILNDSIFENCSFRDVTFEECKLYGAKHTECKFKQVEYRNIQFTLEDQTPQTLTGIYRECNYIDCKQEDVSFGDCDTRRVVIA